MRGAADDAPALTGRQAAMSRLGKALGRASAGEILRAAAFLEFAWSVRQGKRGQRQAARLRQGRPS